MRFLVSAEFQPKRKSSSSGQGPSSSHGHSKDWIYLWGWWCKGTPNSYRRREGRFPTLQMPYRYHRRFLTSQGGEGGPRMRLSAPSWRGDRWFKYETYGEGPSEDRHETFLTYLIYFNWELEAVFPTPRQRLPLTTADAPQEIYSSK